MAWIFNPFTKTFDRVNDGSLSQDSNHIEMFNATTDWESALGGFYTITILGSTHEKGTNPIIQVYELNSGEYELVTTSISVNSSTGDIDIAVVEMPDERFEGKIIIAENN